jgi:ATP-dependent DNA ligase
MLASRLTDERLLADARYIAEPKLDGQRAQLHIDAGRTVACYSRPGRGRRVCEGAVICWR